MHSLAESLTVRCVVGCGQVPDIDLLRCLRSVLGSVLDSELRRWWWAVLAFVLDSDLLQCQRAVLGRVLDSELP